MCQLEGLVLVTWIHLSCLETDEQKPASMLWKFKLLEGITLSGVEKKGIKNGWLCMHVTVFLCSP